MFKIDVPSKTLYGLENKKMGDFFKSPIHYLSANLITMVKMYKALGADGNDAMVCLILQASAQGLQSPS